MERENIDRMRGQAGPKGMKVDTVVGAGGYQYEGLEGYGRGIHEIKRTRRDAVSVEVAGEERVKGAVDGGELFVAKKGGTDEVWAMEYFALGIGGYLPQPEDKAQVYVLRKEHMIGCRNVKENVLVNVMKSRVSRVLIFDVGVKAGGCKDLDIIKLGSKLKVDAVVLYEDGGIIIKESQGEDEDRKVLEKIPIDVEEVELDVELERNLDEDFRNILKEDLKAAVVGVSFSAAKVMIEVEGGTVRFEVDNFVLMSWNDIRRILHPTAWPQDERQRGRMERKMRNVHSEERWPERNEVIRWARENAEEAWEGWDAKAGDGVEDWEEEGGGGGGGRGHDEL